MSISSVPKVASAVPVSIRGQIQNIHVVLPAFNEEASLPSLLGRLEEFRSEFMTDDNNDEAQSRIKVWVVDDGSSDRTAELAKQAHGKLSVMLVSHPENRGLGQAVRTGLSSALKHCHYDDAIVLMDADDTHDVHLIQKLVAALDEGADIAIASRFVPGGDDSTAPPFRRLLSHGAGFIFDKALPLDNIKDFTCGYRAYRASLLNRAVDHYGERLVEERGFAVMVELLLKLRYCNPVMTEVPMVLHYDRKGSESKLRLWPTIAQYMKLLARDRLEPAPFRNL
jgi:dolichol-phosphate mannosyltransferase